jgi:HemY protein
MARFVLFLVLLVPVVVAGNWLLAHPGMVQVNWLGLDVQMHVALAAALLLALCVATTLVVLLLWHLANWPARRRARRRYRTLARGLAQLTHGVTALAMGDEKAAALALKKATAALPNEPLPQLLSAQLAQRQGAHDTARTHLRALLAHPATSLLASKRLIEQHAERQEWHDATQLAEQVYADHPREHWVVATLIALYAGQGNTQAMLSLSEGFQWQSPLSKEERNRYAGLAYYLRAKSAENARAERHALRHAVGFAGDLLPALIDYATLLMHENEPRAARKWLLAAWLAQPSVLLIAPILQSVHEASPKAQTRLLKPFLRGELVEHALLRAHHAWSLGEAEQAQAALEDALAMEERRDACALMAEIEQAQHGEEAANRWLARAMRAPADASWICQACGHVHAAWQTHCNGCDGFDTLQFTRPEARITSVELATA